MKSNAERMRNTNTNARWASRPFKRRSTNKDIFFHMTKSTYVTVQRVGELMQSPSWAYLTEEDQSDAVKVATLVCATQTGGRC